MDLCVDADVDKSDDNDITNNAHVTAEEDADHTNDPKILKDVVAYVDVWSANENMSRVFQRELERLGATVACRFSRKVTHVIYKEGNHKTITRAQKAGVHLLSVLWVDRIVADTLIYGTPLANRVDPDETAPTGAVSSGSTLFANSSNHITMSCKQKKQHVEEKDFPACTPKDMNPLFAKRKRGKMMLPCDYEEDMARNAKRVARKQKKLDALSRLKSANSSGFSTPSSSPINVILVHDTQPRSPNGEYRLTPIRLAIPETPPSMREKMRQLKLAKQAAAATASTSGDQDNGVENGAEPDLETEMRQEALKGLQKALFRSKDLDLETSPPSSAEYSPVFLPAVSSTAVEPTTNSPNTSITDDLLKLADNINSTLHQDSQKLGRMFGVDSDENLLSSQEIGKITNGINSIEPARTEAQGDGSAAKSSKASSYEISNGAVGRPSKKCARRLSVQQALEELDTTGAVLVDNNEELDENPIPLALRNCDTSDTAISETAESGSDNLSVLHDNESKCDISVDTSRESRKRPGRKRKSCAKSLSQDKKEKHTKRRKSKASIIPTNTGQETPEIAAEGESDKSGDKVDKTSKQKKPIKKKLMSLSDLNDQHSVLVAPTKSSEDDRTALLDTTKTARGRKKKQTTKAAQKAKESKDNPNVTVTKEEVNSDSKGLTGRKKPAGRGRGKKGSNKENVCQETPVSLADDTYPHIQPSTPGTADNTTRMESSHLHDNTTHLNLTKDSSVSMDLRETTLSMSMSRAYPDSTLPSSHTSRKSIDEFSVSQRRKQKRQIQMKRFLSSVAENEITDSDNSSESRRGMGKVSSTSQMETSSLRKNMRPSLVMTSLHAHEQDVVISVVKKLGGFVIAESVNETTTHVICGEPRRTLNILQCLARGSWLLSKEWVLKSLEAGSWIEEAEFECTDLFPTCKVARLEREKSEGFYRQSVFMGLGQVYVSGRSSPPRQHLVQLLKLCGGQVTCNKEKASVYIGSDYHPGLTCIKTNWILDCISEHQLLPMDKYMLDRPKRESSPAY